MVASQLITPDNPHPAPLPINNGPVVVVGGETSVERATGIRGQLGQYAQFGAVGVIALLLYLHQRDNAQQARDDRSMFREELRDTRKDHQDATTRLATGMDQIRQSNEGTRRAVEMNTLAVERTGHENAEATRRTADAIKSQGRLPPEVPECP